MRSKLKYNTDFDLLTGKELRLLDKACGAVERFVSSTRNGGKSNGKTRDAHATPYSSLKGTFQVYDGLEEQNIFQVKELDCLIRISNAHMKIVSQKKAIPAYGFSVKLLNNENTVANFPLVNFPLFPINNVSNFLKIFTSINYFFSGHIFQKLWQFFKIVKNLILELPAFFQPSFMFQVLKFIKKHNDFILTFDYYSIGVYRFGDHMVKLKLVPIDISTKEGEKRIDKSIENYLQDHNYELELMVQYCYNLKDQPVNQLNKMWKNSEYIPVGKISISEVVDKDDELIEQMSFNPFDNVTELQPVGRIQKLRDKAYMASLKTRRTK